jgi:hypothetical protein
VAADDGVVFPFRTEGLAQVQQDISGAVTAINDRLGDLKGVPSGVGENLTKGLNQGVEETLHLVDRLRVEIAGLGSAGSSALAPQLAQALAAIRSASARQVGATSDAAGGIDLKDIQKQLDAVLLDQLLPILKEDVRQASSLGREISGNLSAFNGVTKQANKLEAEYQEAANAARQERQFNKATTLTPESVNSTIASNLERSQAEQLAATDQAATATKSSAEATQKFTAGTEEALVKLDRLSQAQVEALKRLDTVGNFGIEFPSKSRADIPQDQATAVLREASLARDAASANVDEAGSGELTAAKRRLSSEQSIVDKLTKLGVVYDEQIAVEQSNLGVGKEKFQILTQAEVQARAASAGGQEPPNQPPPAPAGSPEPPPRFPSSEAGLTGPEADQVRKANVKRVLPGGILDTSQFEEVGNGFFQSIEAVAGGVKESLRRAGNTLRGINDSPLDLRDLEQARSRTIPGNLEQRAQTPDDSHRADNELSRRQHDLAIAENQRYDAGLPRLAPDGSRLLQQAFDENAKRIQKALEKRTITRDQLAAQLENERYDRGEPRLAPDGSRLLEQAFAQNDKREQEARENLYVRRQHTAAILENARFDLGEPRLAPDGTRLLEQAFAANLRREQAARESVFTRRERAAAELENGRFDAGLPRFAPDGSRLLEQAFKENTQREADATEKLYIRRLHAAANLLNERFDLGESLQFKDGSTLLERAFAENVRREELLTEKLYTRRQHTAALLDNERIDLGQPRPGPDGSQLLEIAFAENARREELAKEKLYIRRQHTAALLDNERFDLGEPKSGPDGSELLARAFAENERRAELADEKLYIRRQHTAALLENERFDLGEPRSGPDGSQLLERAFAENVRREELARETLYIRRQRTAAALENERFDLGLPRSGPDGSQLLERAFAENVRREELASETLYIRRAHTAASLENERFDLGLPRSGPDGSQLLEGAFAENARREQLAEENLYVRRQHTASLLENARFDLGLPRSGPDGSQLLERAFAENVRREEAASEKLFIRRAHTAALLENERFDLGLPRSGPDGSQLLERAYAENERREEAANEKLFIRRAHTAANLENERFDLGLPRSGPDGSQLLERAFAENIRREQLATESLFIRRQHTAAQLENERFDLGLPRSGPDGSQLLAKAHAENDRRNAQTPPGIFQSFVSGFTSSHYGGTDNNGFDPAGLAKSAGITAKYALLGSVLYGVAGAAGSAGKELADFKDSVTNVNVALGDGGKASQSFFNELSGSAVNAGANLGQSLDIAASAMEAFKDQTNGSDQALKDLGVTFANEASKIAVISNTTITDAAGNLKAATLGFDIPAGEFSRITDVIAGAKHLGGDPTQIGQGLANLAVSFKELGFNAEETGAIISKVQAETDESGTLIASRLTRATSILGGASGKAALGQLNATLPDAQKIDLTASVRDQILQLGPIYKSLGDAQRQQLTAALGGTTAARELIILLNNANELITQADNGFTGKGEEEYKKRLQDIAAQLKIIQGEVKAIVVQFTNSGILDPFIFLIESVLKPTLDLTRVLLQTFNLIPRPLRDIGAALLYIYGTMKLIQAIRTPGTFGRFGAGARGVGQAIASSKGVVYSDIGTTYDSLRGRGIGPLREGETTILGARQGITDAARRGLGATGSAVRGGLSGAGAFATTGAGVLTIGLVAAAAGAATYEAAQRINRAIASFNKLRTIPTDFDFGSDSLRDSAANLKAAAAQMRESSAGFVGSLVNALQGNPTGKGSAEALREATEQRRAADRLDAATKAALARGEGTDVASTIDLTGVDGLTASLKALDDAGYNATTQFNAIIGALNSVVVGSTGATTAISAVNKTRLENVAGLTSDAAISSIKKEADKDNTAVGTYGGSGFSGFANHVADATGAENLAKKKDHLLGYTTPQEERADLVDKIDTGAVDEATRRATQTFLNNPKNNIKGAAGRAQLMKLYQEAYKGLLPDADAAIVSAQAADAVQKEWSKRYAGITAAQFPAIAKSLETAATGAAQEAGRSNALLGDKATKSDSLVEASTRLTDLKQGKTELGAVYRSLSAKDQKDQAKTYAASLEQFNESIKQAKIDTASATLANMQANENLLEASILPDDAKGRIDAQLAAIDKQLAIKNLDESDRVGLETKKAGLKIQKDLQGIADLSSAARAKIDPRDVVKNAQQDVDDDHAQDQL